MCGIAGIVRTGTRIVEEKELRNMQNVLLHRGPDDRGVFIENDSADAQGFRVGLAHCRLSILDLSNAGHQPMIDGDGRAVIVHNGEIYNHEELRIQLEAKGHVFRSRTDTEVLLAAYLEWGLSCVEHFNGMFAFAIWDREKKKLFCARDRLGIKPFYYHYDGKQLIFSSEIKAILACTGDHPKQNDQVTLDFLKTGLLDHTDETFFQGITRLPAGEYLILDDNGLRLQRYWDFEISDSLARSGVSEEDKTRFRNLLTSAVALRLRGDVRVGSCLSGGIDSASIVCLIDALIAPELKKNIGDCQKAFSAIFRFPGLDERPYISEVIKSTGAQPAFVEPTAEGFMEELDQLLWHQEEPFANSSVYAQRCVFRKASESGIKVMLDGQGADEQLCGYRKFSYFFLLELGKRRQYLRLIQEGLLFLKNFRYYRDMDLKHGLRYFGHLGQSRSLREVTRAPEKDGGKSGPMIGYSGSLAQRIKLDLTRYSLPVLLRYEDKNSMAFSIESRVPYLDFRFVEFVAGLPFGMKLRHGWSKYILRMAMNGIIPDVVRLRKDKLAFDTPQDLWIRTHWRDAFIKAYSVDGLLQRFLNGKKLLDEFGAYLNRKSMLSGNFFFRSFILQRWAERFSVSQ
jgi:asparagine synthase (glutamine-hydrolysing)